MFLSLFFSCNSTRNCHSVIKKESGIRSVTIDPMIYLVDELGDFEGDAHVPLSVGCAGLGHGGVQHWCQAQRRCGSFKVVWGTTWTDLNCTMESFRSQEAVITCYNMFYLIQVSRKWQLVIMESPNAKKIKEALSTLRPGCELGGLPNRPFLAPASQQLGRGIQRNVEASHLRKLSQIQMNLN